MIQSSATACRRILTALVLAGLATSCQSSEPAEPVPQPLRIKLSDAQFQSAMATWSDAALRIDRELIMVEAAQDAKAIRMVRYRRAFAAVILERLRSGNYQVVIVDPDNPPAPSQDLLSTYGHVFQGETGSWAALIQVRRDENPELFELFEATKHDFVPPAGADEGQTPSQGGR